MISLKAFFQLIDSVADKYQKDSLNYQQYIITDKLSEIIYKIQTYNPISILENQTYINNTHQNDIYKNYCQYIENIFTNNNIANNNFTDINNNQNLQEILSDKEKSYIITQSTSDQDFIPQHSNTKYNQTKDREYNTTHTTKSEPIKNNSSDVKNQTKSTVDSNTIMNIWNTEFSKMMEVSSRGVHII